MTKFYLSGSVFLFAAKWAAALFLSAGGFAYGQAYYPNQELRISDLPSLTARSADPSDVLGASVEIIFRDKDVCCGRNSALVDRVQLADPMSLKDVADKLQGRHVMSDGRATIVTAQSVPAAAVNPFELIGPLKEKRALLMEWNSQLYVVYGVNFDEIIDEHGVRNDSIDKLLLLDPRFSDGRREVSFIRQTDDWGKVQGVLFLKAARE